MRLIDLKEGDIIPVNIYQWQWIDNYKTRDTVLIGVKNLKVTRTLKSTKVKFRNSGISFPCGSGYNVEYNGLDCGLGYDEHNELCITIR